jgi:hypothetical protein
MATAKRKTATVHRLEFADRDKSYRFRDRDPDLEFVCTAINESEMSTYGISQRIAEVSKGVTRVAPSTMDNWLLGKVRRPQNFTMTWVAYALGYERVWKKI